MTKAKLYLFPYAGASNVTFKQLSGYLSDDIELVILDYPGHGKRKKENYLNSIADIAEDAYKQIRTDNPDNIPYFLMGHCLGALVVLELCYYLTENNISFLPMHIFLSGQGTPDHIFREHCDSMSDQELLKYLCENNAIDKEMLNPEFEPFVKTLIIDPIKKDAAVYDQYVFDSSRKPLALSASVLYGTNDYKYPSDQMSGWDTFFSAPVDYLSYDSGHFFITGMMQEYARDINRQVQKSLAPKRIISLADELKKIPLTASITDQITLLIDRYGNDYLNDAEKTLELADLLGIDTVRISRKYIYDYLKQLDHFLKSGDYGHNDFDEIQKTIYDDESVMKETYLPGLLLSYSYTTILFEKIRVCEKHFIPYLPFDGKGVEIGFGEGFYLWKIMTERPDVSMDGYDISRPSIDYATKTLESVHVDPSRYALRYGNIFEGLPVAPEQYDFGVMAELIEHIPHPEIGIREMNRILKPDSLLFLTTVMDSNHMDHISNFKSIDEVEDILRSEGFQTVQKKFYSMTDDFPGSKDISKGITFVSKKVRK